MYNIKTRTIDLIIEQISINHESYITRVDITTLIFDLWTKNIVGLLNLKEDMFKLLSYDKFTNKCILQNRISEMCSFKQIPHE